MISNGFLERIYATFRVDNLLYKINKLHKIRDLDELERLSAYSQI